VLGRRFLVESWDAEVLGPIAAGYVDLVAEADDDDDVTVYRIERSAPAWHPFGWSVWRDDELIAGEARSSLLPTLVPSDFARHVTRHAATGVPVGGVALARHGRAVVLTADVISSQEPVHERLELPALAAHAMRRGWALVALDIVPIDAARQEVRPFHRPFAAEPDSPLASVLGSPDGQLVPASRLGALGGPSELAAFVAVRPTLGAAVAKVEPAAPPVVLRVLAAQLSGHAAARRRAFHLVAALTERVPGSVLHLGADLGAAVDALEALA
jgi:hypothetical protein